MQQVEFLSAHQYFTQTAKKERETAKQKNLQRLQEKIATNIASNKSNNPLELVQDFFW